MSNTLRSIILVVALIIVVVAISYLESTHPKQSLGSGSDITPIAPLVSTTTKNAGTTAQALLPVKKNYPVAKEISTPDGFINTDKISISELIGKKVILVDFWTYSCINCQRTTPYLNAWYDKYKDQGLEIIGIHTPEFDFEKNYQNVAEAVKNEGIKFPVVLDNDYSTWNAYHNLYWPHKYLIDIDGYIVYDHVGEGAYDETEAEIQKLLAERKDRLGMNDSISTGIAKPTDAVDVNSAMVQSPETYFGAARNSYLGNGKAGVAGIQQLTIPTNIGVNTLYLGGEWNFQDEFAENQSSNAKITFHYKAKNVYFVAGSDNGVKIKVMKDGNFVSELTIKDNTIYHLIQDDQYGDHTLEIVVENPGLKAFTFTFG